MVLNFLLVADLSVPSIFPTCFIVANHWFTAVVAPIASMFYETGELSILKIGIKSNLCISKFPSPVIFGIMCWAKVTRYNNDRNWLAEKIYRDVFMYYFAVLGQFYLWI